MSRIALIRILLVAAILATFGRIVFNDFVDWDDGKLIYLNPNINNPTWEGLARQWNWKDPNTNSMYDPLVYTTWWALAHVAQLDTSDILGAKLNPQIFHLANLLVHCLTTLVVLEILRRLEMPDWAAGAGAALFALHPLQTEAVAWATGMKDLLGGLLAMLTIWRYLVAQAASGTRRRGGAGPGDLPPELARRGVAHRAVAAAGRRRHRPGNPGSKHRAAGPYPAVGPGADRARFADVLSF
jgi:hypothetical protein